MWDLKTALSAGIAALDLLTADQREQALAIAKGTGEKAQTRYEIITGPEQRLLEEFRKHAGPDAALAERIVSRALKSEAARVEKKDGKVLKSG